MKSKGSVTVEASLVCPIFMFAAAALIELIMWFGHAENVQYELTKQLAMAYAAPVNDDNAELCLTDRYKYENVYVTQKVAGRAYVGINTLGQTETYDTIVYITANGEVYHVTPLCTYIRSDIKTMPYADIEMARNIAGGRYYQCNKCTGYTDFENVYVTSYGNRYHYKPYCVNIRKNYMAVYKSDIEKRRCCSKCGGEGQ